MTQASERIRRSATYLMLTAVPLLVGASPAHAKGGNPLQAAGAILSGPLVLLVCLAALAVLYLIAASVRRQEWLVGLAQSASVEVGRGKVVYTLWGILAEILLISAGLLLTKVPQAGLLVVLVWFFALALAGLGAGVAAFVAGRRLHAELAGGEITPLSALGIGLRVLFTASALPFIGWIVVLLLMAHGIGAVLTASAQGRVE
jgi:hypothetical protein